MASDYELIAEVYDRINGEMDYARLAKEYAAIFERYGSRPKLILDLACGTGRLTRELMRRGFEIIGVDGSVEMLAQAAARLGEETGALLLCQQMEQLELYGTVDGAICCLDGLNSLVEDGALERALSRVALFLEPGGLFVFDLNTRYKFEQVFEENSYIYDYDEFCCIWQNLYDPQSRICDFEMTYFFKGEDGRYTRQDELLRERMYPDSEVEELLSRCGFELLCRCADLQLTPPSEEDERVYYIVKKRND